MDSHADMIMAGNNCIVIELSGRNVSISPFLDEHASIDNIPIITVATAYDYSDSGQVFILILNEALDFRETLSQPTPSL